jgi:hypothetical protein
MQKFITITLALLLTGLATTAMADQADKRRTQEGYASQGRRIEHRLDARGDRIERRFDQKAARETGLGKYRQAYHFEQKGRQINRHLDRKGERIHKRFDHHRNYRRGDHHRHHAPRVVYPVHGHAYHADYVSLVIQQPGLWFGWGLHN